MFKELFLKILHFFKFEIPFPGFGDTFGFLYLTWWFIVPKYWAAVAGGDLNRCIFLSIKLSFLDFIFISNWLLDGLFTLVWSLFKIHVRKILPEIKIWKLANIWFCQAWINWQPEVVIALIWQLAVAHQSWQLLFLIFWNSFWVLGMVA